MFYIFEQIIDMQLRIMSEPTENKKLIQMSYHKSVVEFQEKRK